MRSTSYRTIQPPRSPLQELEDKLKPLGYEFQKKLGEGTYGLVALFKNPENKLVAVKYIKKFFDNIVNAQRCVREIYLLRLLNHPNINSLLDVIKISDNEICWVLKYKDTDLYNIFGSSQPLLDTHVQSFSYQILSALKYLDEAKVMHRDLKLQNILVDANCTLEICDFGLGRKLESFEEKAIGEVEPIFSSENSQVLSRPRAKTLYVVSRWWRAPEIILASICPGYGTAEYNTSSDMWSFGLILLEMLMRLGDMRDLDFIHGDTAVEQLKLIFGLVGISKDLNGIQNAKAKKYLKENAAIFGFNESKVENQQAKKLEDQPGTLKKLLTELKEKIKLNSKINMNIIDSCVDLVEKLLQIDPSKRLTAKEALQHPFVKNHCQEYDYNDKYSSQVRDEKTGELTSAGAFAVWLHQLEKQTLTKDMLKAYVDHMIESFRTKDYVKTKIRAPLKSLKPAEEGDQTKGIILTLRNANSQQAVSGGSVQTTEVKAVQEEVGQSGAEQIVQHVPKQKVGEQPGAVQPVGQQLGAVQPVGQQLGAVQPVGQQPGSVQLEGQQLGPVPPEGQPVEQREGQQPEGEQREGQREGEQPGADQPGSEQPSANRTACKI